MTAIGLLAGLALVVLALRAWRIRTRELAEDTEWSIGIWEGPSPLELHEPASGSNPVLTARHVRDVRATFVADPFMLRRDSRWYMFFEVLEARKRLGSIGLATSADGKSWTYEKIVLREPFHLSYPSVFQSGPDVFMVPESVESGSVRLYRARNFPYDWAFERTLLSGPYVDPSLFLHREKWWMFTSTPANDKLQLHLAPTLAGPWSEHPASPVMDGNIHRARPAGRVVAMDGRLFRFAQDDEPKYGRQVFAFEITELDETTYREIQVGDRAILAGSGSGWNMDKMHHVDAHELGPKQWIACVDGKGVPPT